LAAPTRKEGKEEGGRDTLNERGRWGKKKAKALRCRASQRGDGPGNKGKAAGRKLYRSFENVRKLP